MSDTGPAVTFLDAMIPAHVQEELRRSIPPCPNQPPCEHNGLVHEIDDWDDPSPRCCMDGCGCGAPSARSDA